MSKSTGTMTVAAMLLLTAAAAADDLAGADSFLCAASQVTVCSVDGTCATEPPWKLDIPQFISDGAA